MNSILSIIEANKNQRPFYIIEANGDIYTGRVDEVLEKGSVLEIVPIKNGTPWPVYELHDRYAKSPARASWHENKEPNYKWQLKTDDEPIEESSARYVFEGKDILGQKIKIILFPNFLDLYKEIGKLKLPKHPYEANASYTAPTTSSGC
jgi:hypothetical protein